MSVGCWEAGRNKRSAGILPAVRSASFRCDQRARACPERRRRDGRRTAAETAALLPSDYELLASSELFMMEGSNLHFLRAPGQQIPRPTNDDKADCQQLIASSC